MWKCEPGSFSTLKNDPIISFQHLVMDPWVSFQWGQNSMLHRHDMTTLGVHCLLIELTMLRLAVGERASVKISMGTFGLFKLAAETWKRK